MTETIPVPVAVSADALGEDRWACPGMSVTHPIWWRSKPPA